MAIDAEDVRAFDAAEDASRIIVAAAAEKSIVVVCDVDRELMVHGDRRALKQVLLNLLANAIKFTPENGKVTLNAEQEGSRVRFSITDSGIGISEKDIERLAQPFVQVENQFTKSHKGSGLGLAIARSLIEMHGGSLDISSEVSKGTTVSFALPASTETES